MGKGMPGNSLLAYSLLTITHLLAYFYQTKVTVNDPKQNLIKILVKPKKKKARFFSPRSFLDGVINNALGMVGFVIEARKARKEFKARYVHPSYLTHYSPLTIHSLILTYTYSF